MKIFLFIYTWLADIFALMKPGGTQRPEKPTALEACATCVEWPRPFKVAAFMLQERRSQNSAFCG